MTLRACVFLYLQENGKKMDEIEMSSLSSYLVIGCFLWVTQGFELPPLYFIQSLQLT